MGEPTLWLTRRQHLAPTHQAMLGLGDLVRALALLEPDAATARAIAAALGCAGPGPGSVPPSPALPPPATTPGVRRPERPTRHGEPPDVEPPAPSPPDSDVVPFTIDVAAAPPVGTSAPVTFERLTDEVADTRPPFEPLFRPHWARAIVSTALATNGGHGPLDLDAVVDQVAQRQPLRALPRLPWPTLRRGVQVLIDRSQAMIPFLRDQEVLHRQIIDIVGQDRVRSFVIHGFPVPSADPADEVPWGTFPLVDAATTPPDTDAESEASDGAYHPPLAGTVVLLLTDLGIARPAASGERASRHQWLAFARAVRQAGCPLVAFVPYAPRRWPGELRRTLSIIQWDRTTTAALVRHIVGRAHEVT